MSDTLPDGFRDAYPALHAILHRYGMPKGSTCREQDLARSELVRLLRDFQSPELREVARAALAWLHAPGDTVEEGAAEHELLDAALAAEATLRRLAGEER